MCVRPTIVVSFLAFWILFLPAAASALPEPKVTITYSAVVADGGEYWFELTATPLATFDHRARLCAGCDMYTGTVDDLVVNAPDDELHFVIEYTSDAMGNILDGPVELVDAYFYQNYAVEGSNILGSAVIGTDLAIGLAENGTGSLSGSTITWDTDSYWAYTLGEVDCTGGLCALAGPWPVVADPDAIPSNDPDDDNPTPVDLPTFTVFSNVDEADFVVSDNGTPGDFTDDLVAVDPGGSGTAYNTWYGQEVDRVPEPGSLVLLGSGVLGLMVISRRTRR